jgi:hypothetical protein
MIAFVNQSSAATKQWKGNTNTSWTFGNNWSPTGAPSATDSVIIEPIGATVGGSTVAYNPNISTNSASCKGILFKSGSYLLISTGGILNVYGYRFRNDAGYANVLTSLGGSAYVRFKGNLLCVVEGNNVDFGTLDVSKTGGSLTLNSTFAFTISDHLIMNSNTLNTNDKLTFLSSFTAGAPGFPDVWNTAYIDPEDGGTINGNVTMQQALHDDDDFKTYHLVCSPVYTVGTFGDPDHWSTTMLEDNTVANPDNHGSGSWAHPSTPTPDWIFYDETALGYGADENAKSMYGYKNTNPLWTGGSATNTDLEFAQGCFGRFEAIDNFLDWEGIPNKGNISSPLLTYTSHSQFYDGANLVGNPYPSPIDLGAVYANNLTDFSKFFYIWENNTTEYGGTYNVFNADAYDGDGVVAIGRGFLTFALNNSVALHFTDGDRLSQVDAVFRRESLPNSSYKVKLKSELGNSDLTSVYYGNYHSEYVKNEDAIKIFDPEFKSNAIYTKVNNEKIAMNHLPATSSKDIVTLEVKLNKQGQITITSEKFNVSKSDYTLIFEDRKYGRFINFDADFEYTATCNEGLTEDRFFIHTIAAGFEDNLLNKTSSLNSYFANGKIVFQTPNKSGEAAIVQVSDISGRVIFTNNFAMQGINSIDASQFSNGIYNLKLIHSNGSTEIQKLLINQ